MPKTDLKELAQLAGIFGALSAPQQQSAEMQSRDEDRRMQLALQMMGFGQQQENAVADRALREQALAEQARGNDLQAGQLLGDPGLGEVGREFITQNDPKAGKAQAAVTGRANRKAADAITPAVRAVYDSNKNRPEKIRPTLEGLNIPPEIQALIPYAEMNAGLPANPTGRSSNSALGMLLSPQDEAGLLQQPIAPSAMDPMPPQAGGVLANLMKALFGNAARPNF